jgi:hypothetical protein
MKRYFTSAAILACTMGVMVLATSCAEEQINYTPNTLTQVDTVIIDRTLAYERLLNFEVTSHADQQYGEVNFKQRAKTIGSYDGTPEVDVILTPTAKVEIKLEHDIITVDEFITPEITSSNIANVTSTTDEEAKLTTSYFTGVDTLSDSQVVNFDANWVYSYLQTNSEKIDFAHIEISDVYLASVSTELVDDLTMKVLLNYDVEYKTVNITDGDYTDKVTVSPFYFQKVKEIVDEVGTPYYVCEPTFTYNDNSINCKFIVNKITPHTLEADEIEKIAQRTLKVASIGRPGNETLWVFQTDMSTNSYAISEPKLTTGSNGCFSWTESVSEHLFRAEWNSDGLEVGHTDKIMLYEIDVNYQDENCEFNFDFTTELKVVKNEVVVENDITTEGYIGTRVLTIEGYFNGEKFAEYTGKTTLLQHE